MNDPRPRILLVEDDVNLGGLHKESLERAGFETSLGKDGEAGFALYRGGDEKSSPTRRITKGGRVPKSVRRDRRRSPSRLIFSVIRSEIEKEFETQISGGRGNPSGLAD